MTSFNEKTSMDLGKTEALFIKAQLFVLLFFTFCAFSLEKCGFPVISLAVVSGASYSLLSIYFYFDLIKILAGSQTIPIRVTLTLTLKLFLLGWFLLSLSTLDLLWVFSALAGLLSIVPASLSAALLQRNENQAEHQS